MRRSLALMATVSCLTTSAAAVSCGDDAATGEPQNQAGRAGAAGSSGRTARAGSGGGQAGATAVSRGTQAVTIRFKGKVGQEDFSCAREYSNLGKTKVRARPQDLRFFVQEVNLIASDGSEVPLVLDDRAPVQSKDVALIDLADGSGLCGAFGDLVNTELTGRIPTGTYKGIVFVNGVPDALNHGDLVDAKAPLQDALTHWGWLNGYRFTMAEISRLDAVELVADAGEQDPVTLVHVGSSACRGTVTGGYSCDHGNRNQVRLEGFDPTQRAILVDFAAIFADVDLTQAIQCHSTLRECAGMYAALGVDMETGKPASSQTVFSAE